VVPVNNKEEFKPCPDHVAVIGGGRWARVLTEVLCGLVPPFVRISVHSPHNAKAMSAWVSERGLEQRIYVSSGLPDLSSGTSNAVIVANAARDHEKAIELALSEGVPVLAEKPLTLNFAASQRLADMARSQGTYFAAAHVFLFARYVETFAQFIADGNSIQSIRVHWMDMQSESRYGEAKSYDPGLTVFADWLPHVISILGALTTNQIQRCKKLEFLRGGAHLMIDTMLGDIPCSIQLVRNGNHRQRIIEVTTKKKVVKLDFSSEPGSITSGSTSVGGDPDWSVKPKPVAQMLTAFLQGATGGIRDNRLNIAIGLRVSQIIDQTSSLYQAALFPWLSKQLLVVQNSDDSDLRYALSEIFHVEDPRSSVPVEQRIDYVYRHIKEHATLPLRTNILFDRPVELVRLLLIQGKPSSYH
jgi:predicted dehydrogenase